MSVNTNTVLPWLPKAELTNQSEVIVHEPSDIDPEDQDRKRIQKMALIDDRKKEDQAGQHTPGN
jgi:hypothetical protein